MKRLRTNTTRVKTLTGVLFLVKYLCSNEIFCLFKDPDQVVMACRRHVAILAMMARNIKHQLILWEQDCKIQVSTEFFFKLNVVIDVKYKGSVFASIDIRHYL